MGLLIKFVKWVVGQTANYWFRLLMGAVALALGVTALSARDWVGRMLMLSQWPVEVPRYLFWPWLVLSFGILVFLAWAVLRRAPKTAQNSYRGDILEGFLWRWDVMANGSNASSYGMVYHLTKYCRKCRSVNFEVNLHAAGGNPTLATCEKCHLAIPVCNATWLQRRVQTEIERMAHTEEWRGAEKRIKRATKAAASTSRGRA